jgi:hypothetical protein
VRFEVLMAVKISMVFGVVTPSGLVGKCQRFEGKYCLHLQGMLLRNADIYLQVHTAQKTNIDRRIHTLTVFQNNVLRGTSGSNKEKVH